MKTIHKAYSFDVIEDQFAYPNGRNYTRTLVRHPGAVVILPLLDDGRLLAIRQYRYSLGKTILEFPAGTLEPDELPEECAAREIIEEVGMAAGEMLKIGVLYPAPGFCNEQQHLYFARNLSPEKAPGDEDELIEVVPLTVRDVEVMIISGELSDAKSIAIFYRAKLRGYL